MSLRVLIAGGSGQAGSALEKSATGTVKVYAPPASDFDIRRPKDIEAIFAAVEPDVVINAAAYTNVDEAEAEQELAFEVNARGAGNLARACESTGSTMIHLSTDYVFDGRKQGPYLETDDVEPINLYGLSKLEGERAVSNVLENHVILRVSWMFSPIGKNFVKTMVRLADRDEIGIVNDQHGTPCAASDIAECVWRIVDRLATEFPSGLYHFASKPVTTWYEFAGTIFSYMGEGLPCRDVPDIVPIATEDYPTQAARPRNSVLDSSKLERELGVSAPDWRIELEHVVRRLAANSG